jgi:peptidyl-prolyl cis-trans isomerase B (cyclophilin B)
VFKISGMKINLYLLPLLLLFSRPVLGQIEKIPVGYIRTPMGELWIVLDDRTPNHKKSFIELAEKGYWDSLTFNRVIPDFVAQGGCPDTPEEFTDPVYLLDPEFHPELRHVYGVVGAGRDDNPQMRSARCQFYIVQNKNGIPRLDNKYTVFGKVVKGMDVVDRMVQVQRDQTDEPLQPITLDVDIRYLTPKKLKKLLIE